jgi:CDP-glycerol glycerophosphotransferase (TagB/SpsB family)
MNIFGVGTLAPGFMERLTEDAQEYAEKAYQIRKDALQLKQNHRIWLYYDLYTVKKDNGYYQFKNDFQHKDGVERYYIYNRPLEDIAELFTEDEKAHLVEFGSDLHQRLYLAAELILTAFYGYTTISPFQDENVELRFDDLKTFRVIYLQHGVLHASLRKQNSVENYRANRIVISSYFEKENYMKNYHYNEEDLICTGMARYDHINRDTKPERKILFAPSWREYLTVKETASKWKALKDKIISSDYYRKINEFVNSPELIRLLEEKNIRLELKMHPIISEEKDMFAFKSDRVSLAADTVKVEEYCMFITDFSSFVFDYAYLNRPIMYFVPDYEQFKSGMGHYKDLDLPFEKAFGHLVLEAQDAVNEVKRIAEREFEVDQVFHDRMKDFYFDFSNGCAEALYRYCMGYMKDNEV